MPNSKKQKPFFSDGSFYMKNPRTYKKEGLFIMRNSTQYQKPFFYRRFFLFKLIYHTPSRKATPID